MLVLVVDTGVFSAPAQGAAIDSFQSSRAVCFSFVQCCCVPTYPYRSLAHHGQSRITRMRA